MIPDTKKNYKTTLNLPQTAFAMEAKLVQNEPARLKKWQEDDVYQQLMTSPRHTKGTWVLHDGPPFANGDIHIGHLINKTLKDIILRFRSMQGYRTPYVPGWDCHGLPIEHKIQQELGPKIRQMSAVDVRQKCFAYAEKYVGIQSVQFQRLGIFGDWANPYLTLKPAYESATLEVFARFVEAGLVYKRLKPVPWSVSNQTALADAELEYQDKQDPSIFVEFALTAGFGGIDGVSLLVWTTTPWTLPANLAVAVNPKVEYALVRYARNAKTRHAVVAVPLVQAVFGQRKGIESFEVLSTHPGEALLGLAYRHPFIDRTGKILPADYVTTTDGTGLVHTAPGHGEEDYGLGMQNGLEVYCPVLADGRFDQTVPAWLAGASVLKDANPLVTNKLRELDVLFDEVVITHSYPHDWRSKQPVIQRATEQWFVGMDQPFQNGPSLRDRALRAAEDQIEFVPRWGQSRLTGMLASRPDWCVSRQRAWGLPIPVFYNEAGEALLTAESVRAVARRFAAKGSDAWFTDAPSELLGDFDPGPKFPKDKLRKEKDIFDVWFESGSSWHAVLQARGDLKFPADLYLEGSDQHRGWFQLSLLPSLGATGQPPFKQVLTHGFVVKPDGTKVSKSDKEYVTATQEIDRHGADLLRLWCSSVDYQGDIPTSPKSISDFGDKYRKIRNTLRYLLSNLYDFDASQQKLEVPQNSLDGWVLNQLDELIVEVASGYDQYQIHRVFRLLHDFCAVQISAVYGNAMKDRLYCESPDSPVRRRCQFVMHKMATALIKLMAPILVYTADEAWEHLTTKPSGEAGLSSVHLALLPTPSGAVVSDSQREEWKLLMMLRDQALGQLDALKKSAGVNKAADAEAVYHVNDDALRRALQAYGADLEDLVGVGSWSFAEEGREGPAVRVSVVDRRETYPACARSWKRRKDVGADPEYPDLSLRDAKVLRAAKL